MIEEEEQGKNAVFEDVTEKLKKLTSRLKADLRREMFTKEVSDTIELTRDVSDMTSLAEQVKEHGNVVVGLLKAGSFAEKIYKLTNTVDQIPKETLKESFKCFLRSFELYVGDKDPKSIDSKTVIQDFLKEESALYRGN